MDPVISSTIAFILILNPFALCLILTGIMDDLEDGEFFRVLGRACLVSFCIFIIFALGGETFMEGILGIRAQALRAFGGVIFFVVAYNYVTKGYRGTEIMRGNLNELTSAIAMPFMIGAGTLTQVILIRKQHGPMMTLLIMAIAIVFTYMVIKLFKRIRDRMQGTTENIFDRYVNIMVRANGLIIGALATDMIVGGVHRLWMADTYENLIL